MIAGELDHIVPAHVVRANYAHYQHATARTDFHEFAGRAHLLMAQEGWEEIAAYVANWLDQIAQPTPNPPVAPARSTAPYRSDPQSVRAALH